MNNALIAAIYAMAAATVSAFLLLSGTLDAPTAALAGILQVLVAAQIHSGALRKRERRAFGRDMAELRQAGRSLGHALQETREDIGAMKTAFESRATQENRKIVAELQVLESLMREFAGRIAAKAKEQSARPTQSQPSADRDVSRGASAPATLGSDLLEVIRAALEENRVDLYLQPIVSLPQRKLRFYEALSRLRTEDGSIIMPAEYMRVAAPVGLMSVLDNLLLFRCVQIVRRLSQKSRDIAIFCNISGDTLTDAEFFPQFLEYMHHNRDLAPHIVFEFAQSALPRAGTRAEDNLRFLSGLGFALSMDHVQSSAFDLGRLKSLGFRHLKLRADMLLGGQNGKGADVAPEDMKRLLARHGINLIAERVEHEKTVVQLLDFGVDFGQGFLFGEPRVVREDPARQLDQAEASSPVVPFRRTA